MKKIICEMCGSNDLLKKDNVFVCQSCGTKYSVEEAKKMMVEGVVEVKGNVNVKNAAQLDNLLKLAHSSFDSKNYAQAEDFCNQVIAMDTNNYEAWKLKGESINYQINVKNPRILEVYNCIMTSYRVLNPEEKKKHKDEIFTSMYDCLKGEIEFWVEQFEVQRPTSSMLNKVKTTFVDCKEKMRDALIEFGYDDKIVQKYIESLTAYFILLADVECLQTWQSTVFYNYYRNGFDDEYRPTASILQTYITEGDNLINLLEFCIENFNDKVDVVSKASIYRDIIFFNEQLCKGKSYKRMISTTTNGYGAVLDKHEYWDEDKALTKEAIVARNIEIASCKEEIEKLFTEDNKNKTTEELINSGLEYLKNTGYNEFAKYRFDEVVIKEPNLAVGYLGKAACFALEKNTEACVEQIIEASEHEIKDKKSAVKKLINMHYGDLDYTLLMCATEEYNYEAVKYLIELGADVNAITSESNITALWIICSDKINQDYVEEARNIASILIDNNADPNITSDEGVDLFNKYTDYEISNMLLNKYPNLERGTVPSRNGCYVATCVYGSYDCPQVWTLRRFRDYTLAKTWYGRLFIHTYYAVSPTIVKLFGNTKLFKKIWKDKLDKLVNKLQNNGIKDTPYHDRKW